VKVRKADYGLRYRVERSFAWLGNFRRRLIHWEHCFAADHRFFSVALMVLCLRCLTQADRA